MARTIFSPRARVPLIIGILLAFLLSKGTKPAVDAVLLKIRETLNIQIDRLDAYLKATDLQNSKACDAFIKRIIALPDRRVTVSIGGTST